MEQLLSQIEELLQTDPIFASSVIDMILDHQPDILLLKWEARTQDEDRRDLPSEPAPVLPVPGTDVDLFE